MWEFDDEENILAFENCSESTEKYLPVQLGFTSHAEDENDVDNFLASGTASTKIR